MKSNRLAGIALATFATLAISFHSPADAQSRVASLVQGSAPKFLRGDADPSVLRERGVTLSLGNLAKAATDGYRVIEIAFFEDAIFHIVIDRTEATQSGGVAYAGTVLGSTTRQPAVIVDNGGVIAANVNVGDRRFVLRGSADQGYVARELAAFNIPDHPPAVQYAQPSRAAVAKDGMPILWPSTPPVTAPDTNNIIDVMVVYTPAARAAAGGTAAMGTLIDAEFVESTTVYGNSNVVQRLRLVYKGEVNFVETAGGGGFNTALAQIASPTDGVLDEVPVLRDLYRADFVSLWINNGASCGLGYLMSQERNSFQNLAYNVVHWGCAGGNLTMLHELGHNMGLNHDEKPSPGSSTQVSPEGAPVDPGTTTINYSRGYVDTTNRFRTVMAYNDACAALGFSCLRAPFFSNPGINFLNTAFYPAAVLATTGGLNPPAVGVSDEHQALNDTRETTQNFRQALATLTGPGIVTFLPLSYDVAESAGNVVLTVQRHAGSTGAISVNYTTVNGTATAGSDFTTTTGTLNWANGDVANKTITVPILQDSVLEGYESFTVALSTPTGGAFIGSSGSTAQSATVRIADDEPDTFPVASVAPKGFLSPNVPNANTPNSSWTVDPVDGFMSTSSLRSAQMFAPDSAFTTFGNSDITYTGVFLAGNVSFRYKLSSYQSNYSGFDFMVDGATVFTNSVGGEVDWTLVTQAVTAGTHTLRWRFKNLLPFPCANVSSPAPAQGGANCKDRAWIDAVSMPLAKAFDFSADGNTDLVWQNTDGRAAIYLMNGLTPTATTEIIGPATGWAVTNVADFNGDGKADLVWRHTDGRIAIYLMNGTTPTTTTQILNAGGWSVTHTPDLNGDGKADLLFTHTDGTVAVWTMNGATMTGGASIINAGSGWSVIRVADFDGDGNDDLLWRHTDGRHAIWLMNGIAIKATTQILNAGGWTAMHTPDLDGDGRADIVWQHTDGTIAVWLMDGAVMKSGIGLLNAGAGWTALRVGDFDGDGKGDIVFQHTDGRIAIYLMNGITPKQTAQILQGGLGWTVKRVGDLNGDGKSDLIFENADGRVTLYIMDGVVKSSSVNLLGAGTGWAVNGASQ
ncbi:hypothetical protein BWI17_14660 [Betaproteobacteria bacterium GR16-43]|nr:hypothetical protein BWI17_14660 [Betaproteobacteria bacterium GR16-43]